MLQLILVLLAFSHSGSPSFAQGQHQPAFDDSIDIPQIKGHYHSTDELREWATTVAGYSYYIELGYRVLLVQQYWVIPDQGPFRFIEKNKTFVLNEGNPGAKIAQIIQTGTFGQSGVLSHDMKMHVEVIDPTIEITPSTSSTPNSPIPALEGTVKEAFETKNGTHLEGISLSARVKGKLVPITLDAQGRFSVNLGRGEVLDIDAFDLKLGHLKASAQMSAGGSNLLVVTPLVTEIHGKILDENQTPRSNWSVSLKGFPKLTAITDVNGYYHLEDIPADIKSVILVDPVQGKKTLAPIRPLTAYQTNERNFIQPICGCPKGFKRTPTGDECIRETLVKFTNKPVPMAVERSDEEINYLSYGAHFAEVKDQKGLPLVSNDDSPTTDSFGKPLAGSTFSDSQPLVNFWKSRMNGPNRMAIKVKDGVMGVWYTKAFCIDLKDTKKYVLNVGGDNNWEIRVNGQLFNTCTSNWCFKQAHFLSHIFHSGKNLVELRYMNRVSEDVPENNPSMVWFEMYDQSLASIMNATSTKQLKTLYSTQKLLNSRWDFSGDPCPPGYSYDACDPSRQCTKIERRSCDL